MDAYHQVLVKLLEETGGRDTKAVHFKDLVKKLGFHGNYFNIFQHLSQEGWIAEDPKADFVRITHWGIAEAKKAKSSDTTEVKTVGENSAKCVAKAKEFVTLLEKFAKDSSKDNLKSAENSFSELENTFNLAKKEAN
jgi:hypothetical protein